MKRKADIDIKCTSLDGKVQAVGCPKQMARVRFPESAPSEWIKDRGEGACTDDTSADTRPASTVREDN